MVIPMYVKYIYEGIPLREYCREHDISFSMVQSRIFRYKQKHPELSDDELVTYAMKEFKNHNYKYYYQGISLIDYCKKNNRSHQVVYGRILNKKKTNPELSDEELVIYALEDYHLPERGKYYYRGITLVEYCKNNQLAYTTFRNRILRYKQKHPELSDDELVIYAIENFENRACKYYYQGILLTEYCRIHQLNYGHIYYRILELKEIFPDLSNDELVIYAVEVYGNIKDIIIEQMTLAEYCHVNILDYKEIVAYLFQLKKDYPELSDPELAIYAVEKYKENAQKYSYHGIELQEYCQKNHLNYRTILWRILKQQRKFPQLPIQQIVDDVVNRFTIYNRYYYQGMPLKKYCALKDIHCKTVLVRISKQRKVNPQLTDDELVSYVLENFKYSKYKYYYDGMLLSEYCRLHNIKYQAILERIHKILQDERYLDKQIDEVVGLAINRYEKRKYFDQLSQIFVSLKEENDILNIEQYCQFLHISLDNVETLHCLNYSYFQAISMIWYFSDCFDENGDKMLTESRLQDIYSLLDTDLCTRSYYELMALYKCQILDTRNVILEVEEPFLRKIIQSLLSQYDISISFEQFHDALDELKVRSLEIIDRNYSNLEGQVVGYFNSSIRGYFLQYMKSNLMHIDSLDEEIKDDGKTRLDNLMSKPVVVDQSFSEEMLDILKELSEEEIRFVLLKFQENISDEELARLYHFSLEEVQEMEKGILQNIKEKIENTKSNPLVKKLK